MQRGEGSSDRLPGQARCERAQVYLTCEMRQGNLPWKMVRLEDISQQGFRLAWFPNCRRSLPIKIRIEGLQVLTAHIRWQRVNAIGCEFDSPLHIAVFEHIAKRAKED